MLTALEVHGFKSFADRTRFDFPAGITVIVGPNGSGKSNVVDAIKWVLGTQSPKSLRGSEMTDVIFKGSSAGRKPLNTAEATIVFDNSEGRLPVEDKEVRVTRRVYRSGEGEYLLNGAPCRLRDIKDLFRGTGVGSEAYSIIEQGKVSGMLQASSKDRRAIFEEAAGISRFKAKKIETERRLARVDQNLLRLNDIVEEVESRLKSVRSQATKARRYKEHSDRLQQLRTQVGMVDWRQLSERLTEAESELGRLRSEIGEGQAACATFDAELQNAEADLAKVDTAIRAVEDRVGSNREQIAGGESTVQHQRARCMDVDDEIARCRRQLAAMSHRAGDLDEQLRSTTEEVEAAAGEYAQLGQRVAEFVRQSETLETELEQGRNDTAQMRRRHLELAQSATELANQAHAARGEHEAALATAERCRVQSVELTESLAAHQESLAALDAEEQSLAANLQHRSLEAKSADEKLSTTQQQLKQCQQQLDELRSEQVRLAERSAVLADLERRNEGVNAGVQEVLAEANSGEQGPYGDVCGMLASLIDVHVEAAAVIEAALGELAQCVVVRGGRLLEHYREAGNRPGGHVSLLPLEDAPLPIEAAWSALEQQPGVIGRADRFVQCELIYAPLVRRLLGNTWVVQSLTVAAQMAELSGDQLRFVTIDGAVLEADGRLVLGAASQGTGLISRRSELRHLETRLGELADEIRSARNQVAESETEIEKLQQQARQLLAAQREIENELASQRANLRLARRDGERMQQQFNMAAAELRAAETRQGEASRQIADLSTRRDADEAAAQQLAQQLEQAASHIRQLEAQHKACELRTTTAKVEAAKSEERLDALRARLRQIQRDRHERQRALDEVQQQISAARQRHSEAELAILTALSNLYEQYLSRESLAVDAATGYAQRQAVRDRRGEAARQIERRRQEIHKLEDKCHKLDLTAEQVRSERDHLAQRLRDDYGIDLAGMSPAENEEQLQERESVESEIAELRRKINNIGAVNLDALNELEQLEERFNSLSGQFNDLKEAKVALEKIIQRINTDSRRLFSETLEAIRVNFQALYRKLFGGGHADLVLEPNVDILEAGVEIVANPPGKPAFSNSLLSGGEQGLTAVSLLLAIFQHRPSPFCILDEVDAPLDESNIGRFTDVLREFLTWTRFVIVTHSKKTMTAATTLYGVTMQEPNVSKRVSVRFEDVSDKGEISREAIAKQDEQAA